MKKMWTALMACVLGCAMHYPAAEASTYKVLFSFNGADGNAPWHAGLLNIKGTLYGTTYAGGGEGCEHTGCGTVFSLNPKTGTETVLHSFPGSPDGSNPMGDLIDFRGTLYGTTEWGGADTTSCSGYGCGTVFSLDLKTGAESVLHSFPVGNDGENPLAGLVNVKGTLYGTAYSGVRFGTVFSFNPETGVETVVYAFFGGTDGENPCAGLINIKGTLYGTTSIGGAYTDGGTVFSFDPQTGAETVLHSFGNGTDGSYVSAGLINVGGTLYGTTELGGTYGQGVVFSFDPKTGAEAVLHSFGNGSDGQSPFAGLINVKGMLYGTTTGGGTYNRGTVFSIDPKTDTETVLHSFGSLTDGDTPTAELINVKGKLYSTTAYGGDYGDGTVFSIVP